MIIIMILIASQVLQRQHPRVLFRVPSHRQRFSPEAFKFIADHPFVFIHCHVKICNATDHACARKCSSRDRRAADDVRQDSKPLYSLSEGPFLLKAEETGDEASNSRASSGKLTIHQF